MKFFILSSLILSSAYGMDEASNHGLFVYRQRAIMMAQHQYEMNLDLLLLDPTTCKTPIKKEDRVRVLTANIKQLEDQGRFSHCQKLKFIGERKVVKDLATQKKNVIQIKEFNVGNAGVVNSKIQDKSVVTELGDINLGSTMNEDEVGVSTTASKEDDTKEVKENVELDIFDPIDNTTPSGKEDFINYGSNPSKLPIMSGYAGVPYFSLRSFDETFNNDRYGAKGNNGSSFKYYFRGLPDGVTLSNSYAGNLAGVPKKAGSYSPTVEFHEAKNNNLILVYRGPVNFKILPTPKFTVLNSGQRSYLMTKVNFFDKPNPLLTVGIDSNNETLPESVRTLNSVKNGKYYFEVKIDSYGGVFDIKLSTDNISKVGNYSNAVGGNFLIGGAKAQKYRLWHVNGWQYDELKIKAGDVVGVAIDMDGGKAWYRINGSWLGKTEHNFSMRYPNGDLKPDVEFGAKRIWPEILGSGVKFTANFGDQPFYHDPPKGFVGIPYDPSELMFPNLWDVNTASKEILIQSDSFKVSSQDSTRRGNAPFNYDNLGLQASTGQRYVLDSRGDSALSMEPKTSGRWQFEVEYWGYAQKGQVGIAPSNFETRSLKKLGDAGTGSIGLQRLDELVTMTGKGVVKVDGTSSEIDYFEDQTRFTFDCNFDSKIIKIYANGKFIFETKLPRDRASWRIAMTSAGSGTGIYTLPEDMKYPIAGVKPWTLEVGTCKGNCSGNSIAATPSNEPIEETKSNSCPAQSVSLPFKTKTGEGSVSCEIRETAIGGTTGCRTPSYKSSIDYCVEHGPGKIMCANSLDYYGSKEECEKGCVSSGYISMKCTEKGWEKY